MIYVLCLFLFVKKQELLKSSGANICYFLIKWEKVLKLYSLSRLRRLEAAFFLNGAIPRPATGSITFGQPFPSYMQSFIKIRGAVLEKNADDTMTLRNFNKDMGCNFNPLESIFVLNDSNCGISCFI